MKNTLVGELPRHLYCYVDGRHIQEHPEGFLRCVWFGLVSYPGRLWGCTVLLENGAVYRNVPAHAIGFTSHPRDSWGPSDAQTWDCYGEHFSAIEYSYLSGLECWARAGDREYPGRYLFSVAPLGDGFSAYPEQAKEFCFIQLDNGRLTIQPTNRVVFRERSFTQTNLELPHNLRVQTKIWRAE